MTTLSNLTRELTSLRKDVDVVSVMAMMANYFQVCAGIRKLKIQIGAFEKNAPKSSEEKMERLEAFRGELRAKAQKFLSSNKAMLAQCFTAYTKPDSVGTSEAVEKLGPALDELVTAIVQIVKNNKTTIEPIRDLRGEVDQCVLALLTEKVNGFVTNSNDIFPEAGTTMRAVFTTRFENMYAAYEEEFIPNGTRIRNLTGMKQPLEDELKQIKQNILQYFSDLRAKIIAILRDTTFTCTKAEVRAEINDVLIKWSQAMPERGLDETVIENSDDASERGLKIDAKSLGVDIENILHDVYENYNKPSNPAPAPGVSKPPADPESTAHVCNAQCLTQDGRCTRRTTKTFCYQHEGKVPAGTDLNLVGVWMLSGSQTHFEHSYWEADLTLEKSGVALWKQTKGANMWAKRTGHWNLENGTFVLRYQAPNAGLVEWTATPVTPKAREMGGEYRTPQISKHGAGYGGTWRAQKVV